STAAKAMPAAGQNSVTSSGARMNATAYQMPSRYRPVSSRKRSMALLAFDHVHGESAARGFLVLLLHVAPGVAHGLDDLVERNPVLAVAAQGHARGIDRLHRAHRVALDAGNLHQAADRIAGQAEVVFHADLGGVFDLAERSAQCGRQAARSHRTRDADFALAADFGA